MIGECDFKVVKKQSAFCLELMKRLDDEIKVSGEGSMSGMENHVRKQNDIKRLRRELLELGKMLDPWAGLNPWAK